MDLIMDELQDIYTLSIDGIAVLGINGFFKKANQSLQKMLGYTEEEIRNKAFWDFIHPDEIKKAKAEFSLFIEDSSSELIDFTNRYITKSGDIIWISWNQKRKNDSIFAIGREVTKYMQSNIFSELLKQTFIGSSSAISIISIDLSNNSHEIKYVNQAFLEMSGYEELEVVNQPIDNIFITQEEKLLNKEIIINAIKGKTTTKTTYNYNKSGEKVFVHLTAKPVKKSSSSNIYVVIERKDITNVKEVTEALHLKNEHYQLVSEHFENVIFALNEDFEITFCSPSIKNFLGYEVEEMLERHFMRFLNHSATEELMNKLEKRNEAVLETKMFKKDQSQIYVRLKIKKIENGVLNKTFFHVNLIDITAEENNISLINTKQELLDTVGEMTKTGGWSIDLHAEKITWTNETYKIHGLSKHTFEPTVGDAINFYVPEYRTIVGQVVERLSSQGIPFDIEAAIRANDGTIKQVQIMGKASYNTLGQISRIFGTIQDVTESKSNEAYKRMLESVVVNVEDAVLITNTDIDNLKIVYANRAITKLSGYSIEELLGKSPKILQGKKSLLETKQKIRASLVKGESITIEILNYRKEGTPYWVEVTISPIKEITGAISNFVAIQRDITQSKNSEEELKNLVKKRTKSLIITNKRLENFARVASHDMKTPLRSINSFLTLFMRTTGKKLQDAELKYLKQSQEGVKDLNDLIDSILAYSIVEDGAVKFEVIHIDALIKHLISKYFMSEVQEYGGTIIKGDFPPVIIGSKAQIRQILQNFIGNAIKFKRKEVPLVISISYKEDSEFHYFSIKDNGIGIEEAFVPHVFEPFRRFVGKSINGHGVGLSICKEITETHGGTITVKSKLGKGSEFIFSISKNLKVASL